MRPLKTSVLLLLSGLLPITLPAQKDEVPKGWHLLDKAATGYYGISINEAYAYAKEKKLKVKPVIVAVIGTGIDTTHEDLVSVLWKNPKEIPGNGIDDDHNGYTDDTYGWNFLGSKDGRENVIQDSKEDLRIYHSLKQKWEGKEAAAILSGEEAYEYAMWKKAERTLFAAAKESTDELYFLKRSLDKCRINDSILRKAMDKEVFTGTDLDEFLPNTEEVEIAKKSFYGALAQNDALQSANEEFLTGFSQYIENEERKIKLTIAPPPPYRDAIVKDNYNDITDRFYGNNNVMVNSRAALHGTLISGIIAASRNNGRGADGVTNNVKIMLIRATNDGDEHDKDIALAIRYAVDNGAQIISMAFGKMFSSGKKWVDDAVK
ncbi:MAG: S8 family serine peptidase, partial [Chitinophagaceae bacterium]